MSFPGYPPVLAAMRMPSRTAFTIGNLQVYWYGILLAAAILAAVLTCYFASKRKGLNPDTAVDLCLVTIPCGVVGARLWYVLTFFSYFKADPVSILFIWDGGLSVYGAALFALAGVWVYARVKKTPLLSILDAVAPGLALAQGVALWGDFFNQQGYGPELTSRALTWFPFAVPIEQTGGIHCAVFFYEFLWCALIFAFLWFVLGKRPHPNGWAFGWYVLLYSLGHAVFTALRTDELYLYGNLKTGVALSAALLLLSAALLVALRRRKASPAVCAGAETQSEAPEADAPETGAQSPAEEPQSTQIAAPDESGRTGGVEEPAAGKEEQDA